MKMSFALKSGLYSKTGKLGLSRKRDNDSNSGNVRNGKPDIVFKTVKGFNKKELLLSIWARDPKTTVFLICVQF